MTNFLLTSVDAPVQRRACPTSCTASCSGTPFSQSRSSTSSSMFFGLSCILVLMVSYASQICSRTQQRPSKSHQLLTDKLGNLPWSTLFPFWRWSKWWVHSPVLFFSFLIHLIWAQMERDCQKKRKTNCRYVGEMMIITDLDNQLAEAIAYIPVILRRNRMTFQLSTRQIFSIHQHTFVRWQGLEEFNLKSYNFQASNLLNIFNTSFSWVCICPL